MNAKHWLCLSALCVFTILLGTGASVLLWAYATDVRALTIQAQVISAKCRYVRKRSDICLADLVLTFTYNHTLYTNVSVHNIPTCGYFCASPLPPNATVFIALSNGTADDVTIVQSTDIYHHEGYIAGGVIAAFTTLIMILCVLNLAVGYIKDWHTRREQRRDEFRVPLTIASA